MGVGQFMPSSYRAYAIDMDGSGRRDLWRSLPDALGSIANYLARHGWEADGPIARRVDGDVPVDASAFSLKPEHRLGQLVDMGVAVEVGDLPPDTPATLVELETENGAEYWVGFQNFYVITRYNRSPLYAMAVYQLAEAIRERAVR